MWRQNRLTGYRVVVDFSSVVTITQWRKGDKFADNDGMT